MAACKTKLARFGMSKSNTASGIFNRAANIAYPKSGASNWTECDGA